MTVFLNILFVAVSILFFAGRLYEVLFLLEKSTNFLTQGGIVTRPLMLGIVFLISICCGILLFSDRQPAKKKLKVPVGMFGFVPALCFIGASVLNIINIFTVTGGFLGYDIMMILGSLGLIAYGLLNIKGKDKEKLPMVLTVLFPVAMCMNSVILNIQPIADTVFLYRSLSAVLCLAFFTLLFKNAYAPSKLSRPALYIAGLMNFLISTAATLAGLIGGFVNSTLKLSEVLMNVGLVIIGAYSLFVAFYIVPAKEKVKKAVVAKDDEWEEEYTDDYTRQMPVYTPAKAAQTHKSEPSVSHPAFTQDARYRQAGKISEDTIAMLFAQKEEKEQQGVVDNAVKHVTTEIAVTQALEKQATRQMDAVRDEVNQLRREKASESKTEKSVFKSSGKKPAANTKTVYKAPKK